MTADAAYESIVSILRNDFQVTADIPRTAHLRTDLGLDSLSLTDLAFLIQRDFAFKAEADAFRGVTTVGALAELVAAKAP